MLLFPPAPFKLFFEVEDIITLKGKIYSRFKTNKTLLEDQVLEILIIRFSLSCLLRESLKKYLLY